MELAGTRSWRFTESAGDHLPHVALFVRDAVGLPVAPGPAVPPRLAGTVPDLREVLGEHEREQAGRQWASWWAAVLSLQVHREPPDAGPSAFRERAARRERTGSPPDFAALTDRPALHRAAVATLSDANAWVGGRRPALPRGPDGCFPGELVRSVAEQVAVDRAVDAGDVRAGAVVLDVDGRWWHLLAPGTVVCSLAAAQDPVLAAVVLRRAFDSGLPR